MGAISSVTFVVYIIIVYLGANEKNSIPMVLQKLLIFLIQFETAEFYFLETL